MSLTLLERRFDEQPEHASPFLVLGDPTPDLSVELAERAVEAGASMLELGIPYSDPCADGPAIQDACARAFASGVSTAVALDVLARIHERAPGVPKNLLVYGNLVHARGYGEFCASAAAAGASSLLVPDIPLEEGGSLRAACADSDLGCVQLIAPSTDAARIRRIDESATGMLYLAALQGVTGAQSSTEDARRDLVARVASAVRLPVCLGFGLTRPEHLRAAFDAGARLCVVGSHLARAIGSAWRGGDGAPRDVIAAFGDALRPLLAAVRDSTGERPRGLTARED